jgi:glycine cleavage system H lipoate-binding protein
VVAVNQKSSRSLETAGSWRGWLIRVRLTDPTELDDLLDAAGYRKLPELA